ncbi:hypothetical protein B7463_g9020, partial [Scytalidium lignicola]
MFGSTRNTSGGMAEEKDIDPSQNNHDYSEVGEDANQNHEDITKPAIDTGGSSDNDFVGKRRSRKCGGRKPKNSNEQPEVSDEEVLPNEEIQQDGLDNYSNSADLSEPRKYKRGGRKNKSRRDPRSAHKIRSIQELEIPRRKQSPLEGTGERQSQNQAEVGEQDEDEEGYTEAEDALIADLNEERAPKPREVEDYDDYDDEQLRKARSRTRLSRRRSASSPPSTTKTKTKTKLQSQRKPSTQDSRTNLKKFSLSRANGNDGRPISISVERPNGKSKSKEPGKREEVEETDVDEQSQTESEEEVVEDEPDEEEAESEVERPRPKSKGQKVKSKSKKKGKPKKKDEGKPRPVRIRLDLNLDVEIVLRAKIKGDITITFLEE